jgi:hypothetical protein
VTTVIRTETNAEPTHHLAGTQDIVLTPQEVTSMFIINWKPAKQFVYLYFLILRDDFVNQSVFIYLLDLIMINTKAFSVLFLLSYTHMNRLLYFLVLRDNDSNIYFWILKMLKPVSGCVRDVVLLIMSLGHTESNQLLNFHLHCCRGMSSHKDFNTHKSKWPSIVWYV